MHHLNAPLPGTGEIRFGAAKRWHSRLQGISRRHVDPCYQPHRDDEPAVPIKEPKSCDDPKRSIHSVPQKPYGWLDRYSDDIRARLSDGEALHHIARAYGTNSSYVLKVVRRLGFESLIQVHLTGRPSFEVKVRDNLPKIMDMRRSGHVWSEIADELGMSPACLHRHLSTVFANDPDLLTSLQRGL